MIVIWVHAGAAAVVLSVYALGVVRFKPFAYTFQNQLELFLLSSGEPTIIAASTRLLITLPPSSPQTSSC